MPKMIIYWYYVKYFISAISIHSEHKCKNENLFSFYNKYFVNAKSIYAKHSSWLCRKYFINVRKNV